MKSMACISSSVRAACHHQTTCFPLGRGLKFCGTLSSNNNEDLASKTVVIALQPRCSIASVRAFHVNNNTTPQPRQQVSQAAASVLSHHLPKPPSGLMGSDKDVGVTLCQLIGPTRAAAGPYVPLYGPYIQAQGSSAAAIINAQCRIVEEEAPELDSRGPAHLPRDRLALTEILERVEEDDLSTDDVSRAYRLLALCHQDVHHHKGSGHRQQQQQQQQALDQLSVALNRRTQRMVHRLRASQVGDILQALATLQQRRAISLVLRLSNRASRVFKDFSDGEVIKVLSALATMGQHDEELLAAMEKHLPGRLGQCDPELISTVMEYCLQMRCRSEPIMEAVAENFVLQAERHSSLQIARQIVAMGRLNYLPQCSSHMFKKLEDILSSRFSHFQPRVLIEVLHACIHLERFPLNYMARVFSPYFLQRLQAQGEPLDKNALGQLTQLHLSTSLECTHYWGPRLPYFLHLKRFHTVDQAFETPMDSLLYKQVKGPLTQLLGDKVCSTKVPTPVGYTIDVEICLDEEGYILSVSQWDQTYRRIALFLDGENRFCNNTHHLLGKEATKRRHIRSMGYEVVQIPYFELEKLSTQKEQVQYLHNKIYPTIFKFNHALATKDSKIPQRL